MGPWAEAFTRYAAIAASRDFAAAMMGCLAASQAVEKAWIKLGPPEPNAP